MSHVYAYIRVSTQKQGETGSSLAEQRLAIDAYAKRNNLTVVEWFEEQETAAKRGRAIFTKMLALLLKGRAHGVIIHKIDRGARNLRDWADLGGLIDRGIQVYFAHESLDMQSRGGRLAADIQAVVAADYIRNLRDEVKKGFYGRLRQGLYPLPAPIGYRDQGRGLPKLPDPVMGPLVQHAFALYETGRYNLRTLGVAMYQRGLRNRGGGRVTRAGLSTMLNNSFYVGLISLRRTGECFPGAHDPLIRKSQFDRVQEILRGRTKNSGLKYEFRYRKTLQCAWCRYSLVAEKQKGITYYRCHTASCPRTCVREDSIDEQVSGALCRITMTARDLAELTAEFTYLEHDHGVDRENLQKALELRIANIRERLDRLAEAYEMRSLDQEVVQRRNRALLGEKIAIEESLRLVKQGHDPFGERRAKFLELIAWLGTCADEANHEERRDALKQATSNFQVDQKSLVLAWQKPFAALSARPKLQYSAPSRTRPRTNMRKLARTLFNLLKEEK